MCSADHPNPDRLAVARLLDANLDRAREGLRVLEDWARFGLDRADLVARTKDMRQRLGRLHRDDYKLARHSATDPAAGMGHPAQQERLSPSQVVGANAGRVHEALRVLEEFGRSLDGELAREASELRYRLYDLEVDLLQAARSGQQRRELLAQCHLYLVTSPGPQIEAAVEAALQAGVRLVQYRAKEGAQQGAQQGGLPLGQNHGFGVEAKTQAQLAALHGFDNRQLGSASVLNADQVAVVERRGAQGSALGIDEGQQGHDAGALHGGGEVALLLGGEAGETAGKDLAALGDEFLQQIDILVVDRLTGLDRREALLEEGTAHGGTDE